MTVRTWLDAGLASLAFMLMRWWTLVLAFHLATIVITTRPPVGAAAAHVLTIAACVYLPWHWRDLALRTATQVLVGVSLLIRTTRLGLMYAAGLGDGALSTPPPPPLSSITGNLVLIALAILAFELTEVLLRDTDALRRTRRP